MKTKSKFGMIQFFVFFALSTFLLLTMIVMAREIRSTREGGNWSDSHTWVERIIPDSTDDVVIDGHVILTDFRICDSLSVMPAAILEVKENGVLHTYTIKMVNSIDTGSTVLNFGTITCEVMSPCDLPPKNKKLWESIESK